MARGRRTRSEAWESETLGTEDTSSTGRMEAYSDELSIRNRFLPAMATPMSPVVIGRMRSADDSLPCCIVRAWKRAHPAGKCRTRNHPFSPRPADTARKRIRRTRQQEMACCALQFKERKKQAPGREKNDKAQHVFSKLYTSPDLACKGYRNHIPASMSTCFVRMG